MSKNYDNWERLVRAVLRREQFRELSLLSSPSSNSSRSSTSELPLDVSDTTINHMEPKKMLAPAKQQAVRKSTSMGCTGPEAARTACDSLDLMYHMSNILGTGLDPRTLSILVALCEMGVDPESLAAVVKELRKESPSSSSSSSSSTETVALPH